MPRVTVPKFYCASCARFTLSRVLETDETRRRRQCVICGDRYTTQEVATPNRQTPHRVIDRQMMLEFA